MSNRNHRRMKWNWILIWKLLLTTVVLSTIVTSLTVLSQVRRQNHVKYSSVNGGLQLTVTEKKQQLLVGGISNDSPMSTSLPQKRIYDISELDHDDSSGESDIIEVVYPQINESKSGPDGLTFSGNVSEARITVVTAYFDLGSFSKGGSGIHFSTATYRNWARAFTYLINPLVVYTDSDDFDALMRGIRRDWTNSTKFIRINRNTSWAFQNNDVIARIYSDKAYPKHHPNTVVSEYACAQHAKYDVTARAARENYFHTDYFAWLDVGYFRDKVSDQTLFQLDLPPEFNSSRLSMNFIKEYSMTISPEEVFKHNRVWVGGGLFLGTGDVIYRVEQQFKRAVNYFLSRNLSNTDQQVVFAMFSDEGAKHVKPETRLQVYRSSHPSDWFYLGYLMRREMKL